MLFDQFGRAIANREDDSQSWWREDRWVNPLTGIGTHGDKLTAGQFQPPLRVVDAELTALYNGSDIAAKIVEKPIQELFREGFDLEGGKDAKLKPSDIDDLREYATEVLEVEETCEEGGIWGNLYGGTLLVMGLDDGRMPWEPLDENRIKSFDFLSLVDRRYAYVQSQYSALSQPGYGKPEIYLISNAIAGSGWSSIGRVRSQSAQELKDKGAQISLVHESRCIRFDGNKADVTTRQMLAGWNWSVLQRTYEGLRQFEHAFDSIGYLLSDASQGVFKLFGLIKAITAGQQGALMDRIRLMEQQRSVMRGIAIDAGDRDGKGAEDFTRVQTPFAGIPDLCDRLMLRVSAVADMPATELFGRAPQGMNATGENDTRKWYDKIRTAGNKKMAPKLARIFRLIALSKSGPLRGKDVTFKVSFRPLWAPTDAELATTRLTNAQRDTIYVGDGVVKPEEVAVDLGDVYPSLDTEAREEVLQAGESFEPYPEDPDPEPVPSPDVNAAGEGEPLSPAAPVPLLGTSGSKPAPNAAVVAPSKKGAAPPAAKKTGKPSIGKKGKP
jgi:phage-related protein (TIGR01555 family)